MLPLVWEFSFTALGVVILSAFIYQAVVAPLSKLPGPWHTLFSDVYLVYKEFTAQRRIYIHELHKKFGPVVRLGPNEVSFTSLEALREIYQSGGSGYDKTVFYNLFMQYEIRTMFSTLEKREHDQKKRHIAGAYANTSIMHVDVMGGIQQRVKEFLIQCEKSGAQAMDFYVYLHCYAMDCASFHLLHPHGTSSVDGKDLNLMQEYSYGDTLKKKLCRYRWPTLTRWIEKSLRPKLTSQIEQYVMEACKQINLGEHSVAYKLKSSNGDFLQSQVAAECMNHLAAGIDTTGDALCFLIYTLSQPQNSQIQEQLIKEISKTKTKGIEDIAYLEAVVKEGLRCFPPIPMSQPRYVPPAGRRIDGYFIPAKTVVSCQAWSVHRLNPQVFYDGDRFLPERWLDSKDIVEMNRLFFTFSAGGRSCTGRHLAMVEMKCLLRELYSRYQTRIAPEMSGSMDLYDQAISTRPKDQICLLNLIPLS